MPDEQDDVSQAEATFAGWAAGAEAGEELDFETLLAEHPGHASRLRELHADWRAFAPLLRRIVPGTIVDASGWTLVPDAGEKAPRSADLLERLSVSDSDESRYRLLSVLGRGGGGLVLKVWDKRLRRALAMKLVLSRAERRLAGGATTFDERALSRFVQEARIASQLSHPGIVPVHELGAERHGQAFFTMKLIEGEDLARALARARSGESGWTQARVLSVLLRVCETMAYAHDRCVVHRDLKPANIMVGSYGEVYVVDWGLARIVGAELDGPASESSPLERWVESVRAAERDTAGAPQPATSHGDIVGTPSYMAPEQARGELEAIDARTDIYAVGAILYEVLTAQPQYARVRTPNGPRDVVDAIARELPTPVAALAPRAAPELVAICERAMARESERRYRSMAELASDIRAFLEGRVVNAYEFGPWAQAKKWVQRNRALAASLAAVALLLVSGGTVVGAKNLELSTANATIRDRSSALETSVVEARRSAEVAEQRRADAEVQREEARLAKERAERANAELERLFEFQVGMFSSFSLEVLGRATEQAQRSALAEHPRHASNSDAALDPRAVDTVVRATPWTTVARRALGQSLFAPVLERTKREFRDQPLLAAQMQLRLANLWREMSMLDLALDAAQSAWATFGERLGPSHVDTLLAKLAVAAVLIDLERPSEADPLLFEAHAALSASLGDKAEHTASAAATFAALRLVQGRFAEAECLARAAHEAYREVLGDEDVRTSSALNNLALALQRQGRRREAEPLSRSIVELRRRTLGPRHPSTLFALHNYAYLLKDLDRLDESEAAYREALAGAVDTLGDDHPRTLLTLNNLASLLHDRRKWDEALEMYRASLSAVERQFLEPNLSALTIRNNIGLLFKQQGKYDAAEPLYQGVLEGRLALHGPDHPQTLAAEQNLALLFSAQHRYEEAEQSMRHVVERSVAAVGERRAGRVAREACSGGDPARLRRVGRSASAVRASDPSSQRTPRRDEPGYAEFEVRPGHAPREAARVRARAFALPERVHRLRRHLRRRASAHRRGGGASRTRSRSLGAACRSRGHPGELRRTAPCHARNAARRAGEGAPRPVGHVPALARARAERRA
jgi:serine/threonine protein kinase